MQAHQTSLGMRCGAQHSGSNVVHLMGAQSSDYSLVSSSGRQSEIRCTHKQKVALLSRSCR